MITPIVQEEFFVWVAPDGSIELPLIAPVYSDCLAMPNRFSDKVYPSAMDLRLNGYSIKKVKVTIEPISK